MSLESDLQRVEQKEKEIKRDIVREEAVIKRLEPEVAREKRELERAEANLKQHTDALHHLEEQENVIALDAKRRHEQYEREELRKKQQEHRKAA